MTPRLPPGRFLLLLAGLCLAGCQSRVSRVTPDPANVPMPQAGMEARHAAKAEAAGGHSYGLLLIGDSITHNFEKPEYQGVWQAFFAPRDALNLGYSGGRTENILWNLAHGEMAGQHPKVAVVLIGTNNSDDANYPVVCTPEQIAAGTAAIVDLIRHDSPATKILLLRIFPRQNFYHAADHSERGSEARRFATNLRAGELVAKLADNRSVFFLDLNHVFLRLDGSIDPVLMPDLLHPSPLGAQRWAEAMEPLLSSLLGDAPRSVPPANTALVPVPKLEDDFYDWWGRHGAILATKDETRPDVVLLGDSITHLWGGNPPWTGRPPGGPQDFARTFAGHRVLNLGFGFDRVQNVLWRLDHGEFDGLRPAWVVVNIGTNNLVTTRHAGANTPEEIADGVAQVLLRLRARSPATGIILMGLFPRGQDPGNPLRAKVAAVNALLRRRVEGTGITFLDLSSRLVEADGTISRAVMPDFLHPSERGYAVWGDALLGVMGPAR
jgi:lysophospholipase L1-like esterase